MSVDRAAPRETTSGMASQHHQISSNCVIGQWFPEAIKAVIFQVSLHACLGLESPGHSPIPLADALDERGQRDTRFLFSEEGMIKKVSYCHSVRRRSILEHLSHVCGVCGVAVPLATLHHWPGKIPSPALIFILYLPTLFSCPCSYLQVVVIN